MEKKDLHKLRETLRQRKISKLEREDKIRTKTEKANHRKTLDKIELERRRTSLLKDKGRREKHNFTDQKSWGNYIKNTLTLEQEKNMEQRYNERMEVVKSLQDAVKIDRIDIEDMEWQLKIEMGWLEVYGEQQSLNPATQPIRAK
jgi:hypothetical protein